MKTVSDGALALNDEFERDIENWNLDDGKNEAGFITAWQGVAP